MARRRITVEPDTDLLKCALAAARRLGIPEDELLEQGLRHIIARDVDRVMGEVAAHQAQLGISLSDEEAMELANNELVALRTERRNAS